MVYRSVTRDSVEEFFEYPVSFVYHSDEESDFSESDIEAPQAPKHRRILSADSVKDFFVKAASLTLPTSSKYFKLQEDGSCKEADSSTQHQQSHHSLHEKFQNDIQTKQAVPRSKVHRNFLHSASEKAKKRLSKFPSRLRSARKSFAQASSQILSVTQHLTRPKSVTNVDVSNVWMVANPMFDLELEQRGSRGGADLVCTCGTSGTNYRDMGDLSGTDGTGGTGGTDGTFEEGGSGLGRFGGDRTDRTDEMVLTGLTGGRTPEFEFVDNDDALSDLDFGQGDFSDWELDSLPDDLVTSMDSCMTNPLFDSDGILT